MINLRCPPDVGSVDVNQYGRLAQQHWQVHRPGSIAEIDDPEAFFTELGGDDQDEVRARWTTSRLTEPAVFGKFYIERAHHFQQPSHETEREVLRELMLLPADDDVHLGDDPHFADAEVVVERWHENHPHDFLVGRCQPGSSVLRTSTYSLCSR